MQQQMYQPPTQQQPIQQQAVGQQSAVMFITQNSPDREQKLQPRARSQMKVLSILQIVMGIVCTIFGIILIRLEFSYYGYGFGFLVYGIWGGLYFVLVGGIGLGAVSRNTSCWAVSTMVLNIICSAVFLPPMLALSAMAVSISSEIESCRYSSYCNVGRASLALNSLILAMGIAELVITIWSAVLCCGAVCSCCKPTQRGQFQYNATPMVQAPQQWVVPSGSNMAGQHNSPYPPAVYQPPVGVFTAQPQGPPNYHASNQGVSTENPSYQQPPPTAYSHKPQEPGKPYGEI